MAPRGAKAHPRTTLQETYVHHDVHDQGEGAMLVAMRFLKMEMVDGHDGQIRIWRKSPPFVTRAVFLSLAMRLLVADRRRSIWRRIAHCTRIKTQNPSEEQVGKIEQSCLFIGVCVSN